MYRHQLAVLSSHPIQYKAPLFKELASRAEIDLMVYYCWNAGAEEVDDPGFGVSLRWDVPLLEGYPFSYLPNVSPHKGFNWLGQINPTIFRELIRNRYDAIWINGYTTVTAWLAFIGARISSTPIIFRGEADLLARRSFLKRSVKRLLLPLLFRRIDAFLYSCTRNYEYYRHYGVPDGKLFFCPSAVDNEWFWREEANLRNVKVIKRDLGIPSESPVALFVGKLIPRKRPMDILRAFELLSELFDFSLVYVGEGSERGKLEEYIGVKGLQGVYLAGFQNQSRLPAYYSIADVLVLSSELDPSPKVLNEALAFGLPVVATSNVGTAVDLVKHGENGFVYDVGDVESMAKHLGFLLSAPELVEKMSRRSREIASEWSFSRCADGVLEALGEVQSERISVS